jgi:flagellar biosynthesis/type III secretory pathway protein FliH
MPTSSPSQSRLHLFAEDFDEAAGVIVLDEPEPPANGPPPATITLEELDTARLEGFAAGRLHGVAEAQAAQAAQAQAMLTTLHEQLQGADIQARRCVEEVAEQVAHLVFGILASVFPSLCERHGGAEIARFTARVVATMAEEPHLLIRVHPSMTADAARALEGLEPEHRARITIEPRDNMAPGDARIAWRDSAAMRDATVMWAQVNAMLAQFGLGAPTPPAALCVVTAA